MDDSNAPKQRRFFEIVTGSCSKRMPPGVPSRNALDKFVRPPLLFIFFSAKVPAYRSLQMSPKALGSAKKPHARQYRDEYSDRRLSCKRRDVSDIWLRSRIPKSEAMRAVCSGADARGKRTFGDSRYGASCSKLGTAQM